MICWKLGIGYRAGQPRRVAIEAVSLRGRSPHPGRGNAHLDVPPMILSMIPLGRRESARIDAEDDAEDVRIAAEEAEELALEADEEAGG